MTHQAKAPTAGSTTRQASRLGRTGIVAAFALALVAFCGIGAPAASAQNPPAVTVTGSSQVGVTAAKLEGEVNPEGEAGSPPTFFHFEVSADNGSGEPDGNWIFVNGSPDGEISGTEAEEATPLPVEGSAEGLQPNTKYFIRLAADNAEFANHAETGAPFPSFTTEAATAPLLATEATEAIGYTLATLKGSVDPEGGNVNPIGGPLPIEWYLQYGPLNPETGELEFFENGGSGLISEAQAESEEPIAIEAVLAPGTLRPNREYAVRVFAYWFGGREALSPEPFASFETKAASTPTVSIQAPTEVSGHSAHFSGTVDPNAPEAAPVSDPDVEAAFHSSWHFECTPSCGSPSGSDLPADETANPVQAEASLEPNTEYTVKLIAESAAGKGEASEISGQPVSFKTKALPPSAAIGTNTPYGTEEVELRGYVNPFNSQATDCKFEYGLSESYGQSAPCEGNPNGPGPFPPSPAFPVHPPPALLTARLTGLTPGTTYHWRLHVQTTDGGPADSEDGIFETQSPYEPPASCPNEARRTEQHSAYLPDCRAFEMVSPPEKNGGEIMDDSQRARVATDGSAAQFSSFSAFGDAVGTATASDYESVRQSGGWFTHAITPPQQPFTAEAVLEGLEPKYEGEFSGDLSDGVFFGLSPLTDDPSVANVASIYLRDDLRSPGAGSFHLLSSCPLCLETGVPLPPLSAQITTRGARPFYTGASADFGHLLFESQRPLLEGYPGENCAKLGPGQFKTCPGKLYESDHGLLRLVGLVPPPGKASCSTTCQPSTRGSQAGQGAGGFGSLSELTPHVISADGSRAFFTAPIGPGRRSGDLYLREGATRTVQLNVSEREGALDVPSGEPAEYWGASADGSRVFFITTATLTDDVAGSENLYMYELDAAAGHHLTLVSADHEPADPGEAVNVLGTSSDGHYVYFGAVGQLVAGQPYLGTNRALYAWHDGTVHYIAPMEAPDFGEDTNTADWGLEKPTARVTPDGGRLLFSISTAGLGPTGYDQATSCPKRASGQGGDGCREFYLYDLASQRLSCVSCNAAAEAAGASAFTTSRHSGATQTSWAQNHPLSDDGRRVFFTSLEALVPEDTDGVADVYEYDSVSGTVHLLSSGTDAAGSFFVNADADGSNAFFLTRGRQSATDIDSAFDLYDARSGGGFPAPAPVPAPCGGLNSCHGAAPPPPGPPPLASAAASGPPNPHPIRCRRGKVRRHARCVRPRHHRKRVNANGRASR